MSNSGFPVFVGIGATVGLFMLLRGAVAPSEIPWSWSEWLRGPPGFVLCAMIVIFISHKLIESLDSDRNDPSK